jgi:hypothetical protein
MTQPLQRDEVCRRAIDRLALWPTLDKLIYPAEIRVAAELQLHAMKLQLDGCLFTITHYKSARQLTSSFDSLNILA